MQLETVKSFTLWVLVGVSLLLTFSLWSYQPEGSVPQDAVEDSTDLGGTEETMSSLIEPESIIFQSNDRYFGFRDPGDRQSLYQDMQSWVMYDFQTSASQGAPSDANQVEIIFPDTIPMELADELFTFNNDVNLPDWGFERLFITFNQDANAIKLIFLSETGDEQATAVVNNSEKHAQLWEYLTTYDGLRDYLRVEGADGPIYIPRNSVDLDSKSIAVETINSSSMVDILFTDPDIVSRNRVSENEIYFTDSARGIMRVFLNRRTMEFQNPFQSSHEQMRPEELLEQSSTNINDHLGWTDTYRLMDVDINTTTNQVRYQMYHEGYPVFGENYSTIIEQQYRTTELHQYNRPLFSLGNFLGGNDSSDLLSGIEVIQRLENSSTYELDDVSDIKMGYDLTYRSSADAVTLDPAWFMDYNGSWQKIDLQDGTQQQEEGTEDAMEAN